MIPAKKFLTDKNTTLDQNETLNAYGNSSIDHLNKHSITADGMAAPNASITQDNIENPFDLPQLANTNQTIDLDDEKNK